MLRPGGEIAPVCHPDISNRTGSLSDSECCTTDDFASSYDSDGYQSSSSDDSGLDDDDYPLPSPVWGKMNGTVHFDSVSEYEHFNRLMLPVLQQQLVEHPYNTVGNFVRFYDAFKKQKSGISLLEFFRKYLPPITPEHHTCVGLSLDLMDRIKKSPLRKEFPQIWENMFLASCEEEYDDDIPEYTAEPELDAEEVFKEHVVVSLRFTINGREGIAVLDPGYHVARVVTAMRDGQYPHTGWFIQSKTDKVTKEYHYEASANGKYVVWQIKEVRGGVSKMRLPSIMYAHRCFSNPVELVEKRNLVYALRVWVSRDKKGDLPAGMYFVLKPNGAFTLLYTDERGQREECKIPYAYFYEGQHNQNYENIISKCSIQMGKTCEYLGNLLIKISGILSDEDFMQQVHEVNRVIKSA